MINEKKLLSRFRRWNENSNSQNTQCIQAAKILTRGMNVKKIVSFRSVAKFNISFFGAAACAVLKG